MASVLLQRLKAARDENAALHAELARMKSQMYA